MPCKTNVGALKHLGFKINSFKYDLSLYKGKIDQEKNRKGVLTTSAEKKRDLLKSKSSEAIMHFKAIKTEYKKLLKSPLKYFFIKRKNELQKNNNLKFSLLKSMKQHNMKQYRASLIKFMYI
jgi:UDP-glucose 4-epimerase